MIEAKFEYTNSLLSQINANTTKKSNLINEIALFIILVGAVICFVVENVWFGVSLLVIFAALIVSLVIANRSVARVNRPLLGQKVRVMFDKAEMHMFGTRGDKLLYTTTFDYKAIKKVEQRQNLIYIFFDKLSVVIVPKTSFKTEEDYKKAFELISNNYVV